jgi:hypothetical protein
MVGDMWQFRQTPELDSYAAQGIDMTGYKVEALDGSIGKIDKTSNDVGGSFIVVDTGPWILGKEVLLPAGVISRIDRHERKVYVHRTKEQIENAPEFDDSLLGDESYRSSLASYYGRGGPGWRDFDDAVY